MGECKAEVMALKAVLESVGVKVVVIGELPGEDLLQAVTQGMQEADLFIIMGTGTYGQHTNGLFDTYNEMQRIKTSGKPYFLFNMNPEESLMDFKVETTNMVINPKVVCIAWER
jgi:NAD-dependent SIR2 family protein deacetylase